MDLRHAVVEGSVDRVVPILMTALTIGPALVPVARGAGQPGSEIQAPMAMVIIFGLLSSTLLNMVVVPAASMPSTSGARSGLPISTSEEPRPPSAASCQRSATG